MIRMLLFFFLLSLAAFSDGKKRIVPDQIPLAMLLVSLCPPEEPHLFGIAACLPLFLAGVTAGGVGGGDVKLVGACGVVLGFSQAFAGLLAALCLMLFYHAVVTGLRKIRKKERKTGKGQAYPLVPFLLLGMLISIGMGG